MVVYHNISFVSCRAGQGLEASERLPSRPFSFCCYVFMRYPVDTSFHYKYQLISFFSYQPICSCFFNWFLILPRDTVIFVSNTFRLPRHPCRPERKSVFDPAIVKASWRKHSP